MKANSLAVPLLFALLWSVAVHPEAKDAERSTPSPRLQVLYPAVKSNWHLETKPSRDSIRLHYFDQDNRYVVGIYETAAERATPSPINPNTKSIIRGRIRYRFTRWANCDKGGILWWCQKGTFCCMDSIVLSPDEMLSLARTVP